MASTYSTLLRFELMATGDQSGTWGDTTNVNLGTLIEQAIAGTATFSVATGDVTLTSSNGTSDQSRCMALRITGSPGVSRNVVAPATSKIYVVANGSDANVVLKTSTSTGLTVPTGEVFMAVYDTTSSDFRLVGRASATANTANTLVLRDSSGNFAAGTITATAFSGPINGTVGATTPTTGVFTTLTATTANVTTLATTGNTTLGDASGDTLTVNATPSFAVAVPVTSGGTGVTTSTGTGNTVRSAAPALTGDATIDSILLGYRNIPQNSQSGAYTLVLGDNGKHIYYTGSATTITIPTNASVAFPVGTAVTMVNNGSGSVTVSGSVTLYFAGTTSTGARSLATKGLATLLKVDTDTWFISGVGVS